MAVSTGSQFGNMNSDELKKLLDLQEKYQLSASKLLSIVEERVKLEKDLSFLNSKSLDNFEDYVKQYNEITKKIKKFEELKKGYDQDTKDRLEEIRDLEEQQVGKTGKQLKILRQRVLELKQGATAEAKLAFEIEEQNNNLLLQQKILAEQLKKTNKWGLGLKVAAKAIAGIGDSIKDGYGMLKRSGLFEMDKAIKNSALSMGILSKQAESFSMGIQSAAKDTIEFGLGIEDIAKIQAGYSSALGRTVLLGKEGGKALGAMAVATGLGNEGAAEMAAEMNNVGYSAKNAKDTVEGLMDNAHMLGLDAFAFTQNLKSGLKLLNRFNFKGGVQSLAKMVELTQKMGVSLDIAAPMAEKLFNVEGAVEMSAQLQVLGGEWSKLADPFKLMYMARNDMEGLTDSIIKAATGSAKFNKATNEFDISALEMQRLRQVAEATGLDFEQLAVAAKRAAQFAGIKKQISFGIDKDTEKFIEATAYLDKNGTAKIMVGADEKTVSQLTEIEKKTLKTQAGEREAMEERAKQNRTFDDALNNTMTYFKQILLPVVEVLNKDLLPKLDTFVKNFKDSEWPKRLGEFGETVGKFIGSIGKFIIENPKLIASLYLFSKVINPILDRLNWFNNGLSLSKGFLIGTNGGAGMASGRANMASGGAGMASGGANIDSGGANMASGGANMASGRGVSGGFGNKAGNLFKRYGGAAIGGAIGGALVAATTAGSTGEGIGDVVGGAIGSALGTLLDPVIGPLGTYLGGTLGTYLGGTIGKMFAGDNKKVIKEDDAVIKFNDNDKFMKVNDSTMIAGTNAGGNRKLADSLAGNNASIPSVVGSIPNLLNINFGDLRIAGAIELKIGQNYTAEIGKELINNAGFIRDLTKLIHMETSKNLNGGIPRS